MLKVSTNKLMPQDTLYAVSHPLSLSEYFGVTDIGIQIQKREDHKNNRY